MVALKLYLLFQYCIILCLIGRLNMLKVFFLARMKRLQGRKNKIFLMTEGCRS